MSRLLEALHADHVNVLRLLEAVARQLEQIHAGGRADRDRLLDIMRYMTEYPDRVHHPKEDVLFERLVERDQAAGRVVGELVHEHRRLAEAGRHAHQLLQQVAPGTPLTPRSPAVAALEHYAELLRRHMDTEESRVFPLARTVLDPADWQAIESRLDSRRDPLFGGRIEDSYRALYTFVSQKR